MSEDHVYTMRSLVIDSINDITPSDYVVTYKGTESQCQRAEKEVPGQRRSAIVESAGDMQAGPARYVSVSELYSTDEVELLLDEIRELEPTSCRGEDVQDFEIAGSGCGAGAGGRSPAGTELTERSWDSHAQYRRAPPPRPRPLAPLYCRLRHLLTPSGAATLLLVLCCASACGCVWAGAGLRLGGAALEGGGAALVGRVRLLLLAALSSLLLHSSLLFLHITRLVALLPLDWNKVGAATSVWSCASLAAGGALTLAGLAGAGAGAGALLAGGALALGGAGAALALALLAGAALLRRRAAPAAAYRLVPADAPDASDAPPAPQPAHDDPL